MTIWSELSEVAGSQLEPELADLRPGELQAQLPGRQPRRARAGLARGGADRRGAAADLRGARRGVRARLGVRSDDVQLARAGLAGAREAARLMHAHEALRRGAALALALARCAPARRRPHARWRRGRLRRRAGAVGRAGGRRRVRAPPRPPPSVPWSASWHPARGERRAAAAADAADRRGGCRHGRRAGDGRQPLHRAGRSSPRTGLGAHRPHARR